MIAIAVVAMASCAKEEGSTTPNTESTNVVAFSAGAISRVSSDGLDNWENGDEIGVFTDGFDTEYSNVKYIATTASDYSTTGFAFDSSVGDATQILYPNVASGTVNFYAYYPYMSVIADLGSYFSVVVSDQDEKYGKIDFMSASALVTDYGVGTDVNDKEVAFTFYHKLAKVVLNITTNDNLEDLDGLTTTINNIYSTRAYSNLGAMYTDATTYDVIANTAFALTTEVDSTDKTIATVTAILHPMDEGDCSDAVLTFAVDGRTFTVGFNVALTCGYVHTYDIALGNDVPVLTGSTISPWSGLENPSDELYSEEN